MSRKSLTTVVLFGLFLAGAACTLRADVRAGVSIDENGLKGFYLAIGDHYRVPENEVVVVRQNRIPDDDLPVVFFLAQRAGTKPKAIVDLRLGGMSWMDITLHFGLYADIYHIDVPGEAGPPYERALGHFKSHKKSQWREIRLDDPDIVNLVNLRFISEHYHWSPAEVMKMRQNGRSFVVINGEVHKAKSEKDKEKKDKLADKNNRADKSKGKGKSR